MGFEQLKDAYLDVLNSNPYGIVVYDNAGNFFASNQCVREMLTRDGLKIGVAGLSASEHRDQQRLSALIRVLVSSGNKKSKKLEARDITVSRPSGKRDYQLLGVSLSSFSSIGRRPAALICIHDPESPIKVPIDRVRNMYGPDAGRGRRRDVHCQWRYDGTVCRV